VKIYFFYPERQVQTVRRVYRFTVDVRDSAGDHRADAVVVYALRTAKFPSSQMRSGFGTNAWAFYDEE
jgi:hypothetical protein